MLFDVNTLFYHTGSAFAFTAGEYVSLVGVTETGLASSVIDMGVAQDLGVGDTPASPQVAILIGASITTANTTASIQFRFQGSTDSTNWTNYAMTDWVSTASLTASTMLGFTNVPRRSAGAALPRYYRLFADLDNTAGTQAISTGTIIAGIVIQRDGGPVGAYPSNFTVV